VDLRPAVGRGTHLEHQFRHDIKVSGRERASRHQRVAVEGNVGAANRVRVTLGQDPGIVHHDVAEIVLLGIDADDSIDLGANLSMSGSGHVHLDHPPLHQLGGHAAVGQLGVLAGAQQARGGVRGLGDGRHTRLSLGDPVRRSLNRTG
jgi:hypothetical protein